MMLATTLASHHEFFWWGCLIPFAVGALVATAARILNASRRQPDPLAAGPADPSGLIGEDGVDPFDFGSAQEQRRALRRQGNPVAVLVADATGKGEPRPATVIDRSVHGLRLAVDHPVALQTILSLRPAKTAAFSYWTKVGVVHCRRTNVGWELGCQFVHNMTSGLLWQFG
jgi:hypothetical protein